MEFGQEFNFNDTEDVAYIQPVSNDEVFYLMSQQQKDSSEKGKVEGETFAMTYDYLEKVVTTNLQNDIVLVSEALDDLQHLELELKSDRSKVPMHAYERVTLSNLVSTSDVNPEEVVSWIPSLGRFDDDQVQKAIDFVVAAKSKVPDFI